jgi:cell filamentation protein
MAAHSRYDVSREGAGIDKNGVLINKLGILDQKELDDAETLLLKDSYAHFFELLSRRKIVFDLSLLFTIHKYFLDTLYAWAGKVRGVDISKSGALFAPVAHIISSLQTLEILIQTHLPKRTDSKKRISEKIAIIHNELNAIHPFREGNGRTIRLFLDLMVADLSLHPVNWSVKGYMDACQKGMSQDHSKMARIIYRDNSKKYRLKI